MKIAEIELENGQIPFIIRRPLPDGTSEYWPVNELQIL
jgi:DNA-directed RNA polymerase subunit K/omega